MIAFPSYIIDGYIMLKHNEIKFFHTKIRDQDVTPIASVIDHDFNLKKDIILSIYYNDCRSCYYIIWSSMVDLY